MQQQDWQKIKDVFALVLEQPKEQRPDFLREICADDPALREEVESLLDASDTPEPLIERSDYGVASIFNTNGAGYEGQIFGHYKIIREIGRGGMGTVFLGQRNDDQYHKFVAIKVVRRGMDSADILRRFRNERQILASLEHPNIARLLDGGTTDDGLPYLVMEYVEGTPITHYCDQHRLTTNQRLQLFRTVCAAVQHAHQHLVVHRDLKPSNILITTDGTPKLLDFGIAKVLSPEPSALAMEHTVTELRVLTPDYASPEQVRGEKLTTTSDIYSLGVVLYELLTGHRPYRATTVPPHELARVICEREPTKPSTAVQNVEVVTHGDTEPRSRITPELVSEARDTVPEKLRRRLAGDLDNIVMKAMRKEPQRRYESAAQLAADIERHLEGMPVIARKDTFAYRSTKFIKRHKVGVAAAALIILTLIGGIIATTWQARVARAERAKAERRFNDVRKLSNSVLFELHDAIEKLPGSTPARELLTKRALEYLDSLAQESGDDPALQRELVAAYLKVGNVQGNPNNANLGDTSGALASFRKAMRIAEQLTAAHPTDVQAQRSLATAHQKMGELQSATGDIAGAVESLRESLAIFQRLAEENPTDTEARQSLAISYIKLGDVLGNPNFPNSGDQAGAMQNYHLSSAIWQSLYASDPTNPRTRRFLGLIYERIGTMLELAGDAAGALDTYHKSLVIREQLAVDFPTNTDAVRDAAIAHEKVANIMVIMGDVAAALESRHKSLEIFKGLAAADPQNAQARRSLAISYIHLGDVLGNPDAPNLGRRAGALKNYKLALETLEELKGSNSSSAGTLGALGRTHERIGIMLALEGNVTEALNAYRRALEIQESLAVNDPANAVARRDLAELYAKLGQLHATLASDIATPVGRRIERWREARMWYQRSLDVWQGLDGSGMARGAGISKSAEVQAEIDRCDAALAKL